MRAYSAELREPIVDAIDRKEGTWAATAARFRVSVGFVSKLLRQRRRTGSIEPRKGWTGSPPALDGSAVERLRAAVDERPESTLDELRRKARLACSLPTVCRYLRRLGYSRKKSRWSLRSGIAAT